ncbi:MAG TPA: hypothetical protein VIC33_13990 [Vicinamibacterales bacterium]|jgi:hypothetical protein
MDKESSEPDNVHEGPDPRAVRQLKTVTDAEWRRAFRRYRRWFRSVTMGGFLIRPRNAWPALAAAALLFYVGPDWLRILAGIFAGILTYKALYAQAHGDGYYYGYVDGVNEGVNRALGLSEAEANALRLRAEDLDVEEGLRDRS